MIKLFAYSGRALAATALLGAVILATPSHAQTSGTSSTDTAAPARPAPAAKPVHRTAAQRLNAVESRIANLHSRLKITPEQEPKWAEVAQVMRDNAQHMEQLQQDRHAKLASMSAVDDLRSYLDVTQAHVDGLQKLIPAFQGLYDAMTPDQQKNADAVFAQFQRPQRRGGHKTSKGS